jgi:ribonucleoside-diphosphate reductase alpha chain
VTEEFMQAVMNDAPWPLVFPADDGTVERVWSGSTQPVQCAIHRTVRARALWQRLCDSAYDCAEPGVLFVDRINGENNLAWRERLTTTNPCAEAPLPPYGACHLGSLNLAAFVLNPFSASAHISEAALTDTVRVAVRFLDDVVALSHYPLERQRESALETRRIGIGITGLADSLAMLGLKYDSEAARAAAAHVMTLIRDAAYSASIELAAERGAFPALDKELYLASSYVRGLPHEIREGIVRHGIRNSHLLAIAPAGAISLLADNVSSGIEPIFGIETLRRLAEPDGTMRNFQVTDYAYTMWRRMRGPHAEKPDYFVEAEAVAPRDQLLMQAALTPFVDGSISKTISLPRSFSRGGVTELYETAHLLGLKGCTVFCSSARASTIARVSEKDATEAAAEYCCTTGRSND